MKLRKKERSRNGLANRTIKNPLVQYAGIFSYAILLMMRIPLLRVMKDAGMGLHFLHLTA